MRRVPLVPTLVVAAAIATMLGLGLWQLQRLAWKEALIARYAQARTLSAEVAWPRTPGEVEAVLFRHATLRCERVLAQDAVAGRSASGESGWAQEARCALDGGGEAEVALGWSRNPQAARWAGGTTGGIVAQGRAGAPRLIATTPPPGLEPLAAPDPRDIPNNHLAYAVQWFLFAGVAAVIYALALRKRLAAADPRR